jgi:cbb3-type cytochrome oxidase maturation protein
MVIIMYLAIFMVIIGMIFLGIFLFAVKNGQFEDLETPSHKLLIDDNIEEKDKNSK